MRQSRPKAQHLLALVGALSSAVLSDGALAEAPKVNVKLEQWTLKNGLHVVFSPHRGVPVATVQVWYHVGSKNEKRGIRGLAHMFEHLMFKGSQRVRPEKHAQLLSALGGTVNAFTTQDVTAYHDTLPKQYFELALELEAERMRHLVFRNAALASERKVVIEEKRQRLENSPIGRALEAIHELSFRKHPYAWTPAGDINDLDGTVLETYRRFYNRYYVPNNATVVVVGDLDKDAVIAAVKKHFGAIKRKADPPKVSANEPPQTKGRELTADWASQLNVVLGAYHIPPANHADIAPLNVLSAILSSGRSSRLYRELVRKQKLALGAGGFVYELEHPGLFFIYAVALPNKQIGELKRQLLAQIAQLSREPVSPKELSKAKNQLATDQLRSLRTANGLAQQIGMSTYLYGDPTAFTKKAAQIESVTAADVSRVAKAYLVDTNLSMVLVPAGPGTTRSDRKGGAR